MLGSSFTAASAWPRACSSVSRSGWGRAGRPARGRGRRGAPAVTLRVIATLPALAFLLALPLPADRARGGRRRGARGGAGGGAPRDRVTLPRVTPREAPPAR